MVALIPPKPPMRNFFKKSKRDPYALSRYWKSMWERYPEMLTEHLNRMNKVKHAKLQERLVQVRAVLIILDPQPMRRAEMELALMDAWFEVFGEKVDRGHAIKTILFAERQGLIGKDDRGYRFPQLGL